MPKKVAKKFMEKMMKEREDSQQDEDSFTFSESHKKGLDENIEKLERWINEEASETFSIQENNSYKRWYYFCYIEKHHKELTRDTVKKGNDNYVQVMRFNETQTLAYFDEKKKAKFEKFESEKGFTKVFELISDSKIPIVGHNCLFDLLFWMRHFHNVLSPSYSKFKKKLNKYFPNIYDTKFIGNNSLLKNEFEKGSSLCHYHKSILQGKMACKNLEFVIPEGFEGYRLDTLEEGKENELIESPFKARYHEAGYDAFITGIALLHFEKTLNMANFEKIFVNKLNVMTSFFIMDISGKDVFKPSALVFVLFETNNLKDFKKLHRIVEHAFRDLEDSIWVRPNYFDNEHPIFISLKEGGTNGKELSEELSNYFNINKRKETFYKILFKLKSDGYNIVSFAKYLESKMKNNNGKKKEEVFDI